LDLENTAGGIEHISKFRMYIHIHIYILYAHAYLCKVVLTINIETFTLLRIIYLAIVSDISDSIYGEYMTYIIGDTGAGNPIEVA